jgi:hypothetical protein
MLFPFSIVRRLLFLALFLALPLVVGEIVVRKFLGSAVKSAIAARIGGSPQVSFGSTPVLWQLVHGHLDDVTVSETDARLGQLPPMTLAASFHDVHITSITGLHGAIGQIDLQTDLQPHSVLDLLATPACIESLPASVLEGLTGHPRLKIFRNHISVLPPSGRVAELRFAPAARANTIVFRLIGLVDSGATSSTATLDSVAAGVTCARTAENLPLNLRLVSARARPGKLLLGFSAPSASFSGIG